MRAPRLLYGCRLPRRPTSPAGSRPGRAGAQADLVIVTVVPDSSDMSNSTVSMISRMM
jgi:hypothetical protein